MSDLLPEVPEDWSRGLAVVAHPDDLEYGAASAVARWTAQGKDIVYVLVTDGEAGIEGMSPAEAGPLRREEERRSAAVVGVEVIEFLGMADGLVEADQTLRRALAAQIRRHRPEVVISINFRASWGMPSWNHVDHRNVGIALLDASRDASNRWMFPELLDQGLEPWSGLRLVAFNGSPQPTHAVDVGGSIERGIASLREHGVYLAALDDGTAGREPEPFLRGSAAAAGPALGVEYAVTFEVIPV
jgi:LmbE family N-acetylglucosaminyl deacetylase